MILQFHKLFFFAWFLPGSCLKAIKQQWFNVLQPKATLPSPCFYFKWCKILHSKMFQCILKWKQTNFCCFTSLEGLEILVPLANMRICPCVWSLWCHRLLNLMCWIYCILHSFQKNEPSIKDSYSILILKFFIMIVGIVCLKKLHESDVVCGSYKTKTKENLMWENVLCPSKQQQNQLCVT